MTVKEFLLHRTKVGDVCVIADCGYDLVCAVIDHEDLFVGGIPKMYLDKTVLNTKNERREWAVNEVTVIYTED